MDEPIFISGSGYFICFVTKVYAFILFILEIDSIFSKEDEG